MSAETLETAETVKTTVEHRILRRPEVEARIGFKRSQIYKMMNEGKFPKAKHLGIRTVGWDSAEIDQWIAERLADPV
ncbi:MAG: AlpA family transcriptional regulator [Candidatus Accumulibacter sp.]|jgi:prophage regulatory protein|nr:AlpA family transcriptional regulator [Accumulibacter sp.]